MVKKIVLCAVLILILVPAFAMAAGPQGQGGPNNQGNGMQVQQQIATQEQVANPLQLNTPVQNNGEVQMLQNRICSQECERTMVMNQNQSRFCFAAAAGERAITGSGDQQQDQTRDMVRNRTWDRIRDRINLHDGSCGNCPNS